jgi:hypothetical protein
MEVKRAWTVRLVSIALAVYAAGCSEDKKPDGAAETPEATVEKVCAAVVDKLTECGVISGLHLKECGEGDTLARCVAACVDDADCDEMKASYCDDALNDFSDCLSACHEAPPPDFVCADGSTIPASWRCSGAEDCPGGEDEDCPKGSFVCEDGLSIPAGWKCDKVDDCSHGEDEGDCPGSVRITCDDGSRLPARFRCDGSQDCADGEDELDCAVLMCE